MKGKMVVLAKNMFFFSFFFAFHQYFINGTFVVLLPYIDIISDQLFLSSFNCATRSLWKHHIAKRILDFFFAITCGHYFLIPAIKKLIMAACMRSDTLILFHNNNKYSKCSKKHRTESAKLY